ncbi:MAG: SMP-30/gluconolactonase/LRE family protein [Betaproteobacteria bacterium]|jgi:L-arabinonolactonase
MSSSTPRVVVASQNQIGESPVWSTSRNALYWVDVEGRLIQRWQTDDASTRRWTVAEPVGCIGLRGRGGLVGACRTGFFFFDETTGLPTPIADPEADQPDNRFNDGKVDRRGRFWAGTRNFRNTELATGRLYRLDADLSIHRMEEGLRCPNGMAWSPDDRLMYLCDTWSRRIFVYDFDADEGVPRNRRLFTELPETDGFPDGLTVDADGCIWNAHYDGWRITRYTPDGKVDRVIPMPVQHVTSLTFGGSGYRMLYVTTSFLRLSNEQHAAQPDAGHLFAIKVPAQGLPEPAFGG